jgi:hypothetical protein
LLAAARIEPDVAAPLRRVLAEYAAIDNLVGPGRLLPLLPAQLALLEDLLRRVDGDARLELLDVAARGAEFLGWLYQDAGDPGAAAVWSGRALDYALQLGDPRLVSYVLMRKSNIASDAQDGGTALDLARAALRDWDRLTPRLRAVALRQEAHAHALRRDALACARALDRAMTWVMDGRSGGPEFDLTAYCTPAYVGMEAAASWIQLGRPKQAIATFEQRLTVWPPGYKRDLGLCLARLAVAHAAARDLERAQAVGQQAAAVVRETRSARSVRELARLDGEVARWGTVPEMAELRRTLREVTGPAYPPDRAPAPQPAGGGLAWA